VRTRFSIDLLHPGRVARTWQEWFIGAAGRRRLAFTALGCLLLLLLVFLAGMLPTYRRLSEAQSHIPRLRANLGAAEDDLNVLKANLRTLSAEARRQVPWGDVLETLSQQTPPTLRLQRLEASRVGLPPRPGQPAAPSPPGEGTLRIVAVTPLRPGSSPLLEVAQFMAGLMRDPAVHRRFQLKSWEVKPPASTAPDVAPVLHISVTLAERPL
jgi:type II secretory pathway component PulM